MMSAQTDVGYQARRSTNTAPRWPVGLEWAPLTCPLFFRTWQTSPPRTWASSANRRQHLLKRKAPSRLTARKGLLLLAATSKLTLTVLSVCDKQWTALDLHFRITFP